mgnify:CR=1 FL=1
MTPDCIVVDFETEAIESRPRYPPMPVGVALYSPGPTYPGPNTGAPEPSYMAWGHPSGNNCTMEDAARRLKVAWATGKPILFHNAKFDMEVARVHFGLPYPKFHDTMFLLFLADRKSVV